MNAIPSLPIHRALVVLVCTRAAPVRARCGVVWGNWLALNIEVMMAAEGLLTVGLWAQSVLVAVAVFRRLGARRTLHQSAAPIPWFNWRRSGDMF